MKRKILSVVCLSICVSTAAFGQDACAILAQQGIFDYTEQLSEGQSFQQTVRWLYEC